ncbi:tRNA-intron lyase [Saccharolobus islandicus]|uniref:tRNA-splicing endonuclease n=5 Tax=Saccharolobus islandicus TaxID=43080 RepID=ENDA_SACI3|nr:tRNA-intron lyase [Sulfolobus islandicus]C3N6N2.1 RecName: Full=tRNA-splicing endonuclease; AltName: Full=tRNA-intron endonuclease [Sulfolobus islandicus M.16.27]C4KIA4.1 RecName: Full=tRNA-splicing endonuclease; AltName: Full=tRNA-intron endonuclease [Sulfolobus islandicus M.16.4]ACP55657.1 tRNA intron endonuclease [Sulfolobus islandicus M.16.27]ACR42318.1 tRNA intron endonuclease [Sulfolobus islandicus M.16.4]ADX82989.1 archaeal intron splicing enzyme, alpha subunit [Sulfolobus islandicus
MVKALLVGSKVLIPNVDESRYIYSNGFYGKAIGISKPKGPKDIIRPLELSLIESVYLAKKGLIKVIDKNGEVLEYEKLYEYSSKIINKFDIMYRVYEDLREKGFIVRSGVKYGADFAVYTLGPGLEHAPYVVIAVDIDEEITPHELLSFGRVSHSTRKRLVLALVDRKSESVRYIMFKWVKM